MNFSHQEYNRRYNAMRALMQEADMDCLLITGRSDDFNRGAIRYVTGMGNGGICILPADGDPVFLVRPYHPTSPKLSRIIDAHELLDLRGTATPEEQAIRELENFHRGNKIGIVGLANISVSLYQAVAERFPGCVADAGNIFNRVSMIKSEEEVAKLRVAAGIADKIYRQLREIIRPGLGEYEIYGSVKKMAYASGCDYSFDLIDGAGSGMNMSFFPTPDKLETNGTLFFEITPAFNGYYAQLPVTLPVTAYQSDVYQMVSTWAKSDEVARKILKPGIGTNEIFKKLVATVEENGFISPFEVGHDLGVDTHGPIYVDGIHETVLEPGMVLAIHASVMSEIGGNACGMGYTYLITESGAERFSQVDLIGDLL